MMPSNDEPVHEEEEILGGVSLIEQGVFSYPKGMQGWRFYRIEYGGHAQNCSCEGSIWLPKYFDAEIIEKLLS